MANPSGLKPVTIEAMFNTMTGCDPNQRWKLDEATGELIPDDQVIDFLDGLIALLEKYPDATFWADPDMGARLSIGGFDSIDVSDVTILRHFADQLRKDRAKA